jgi:hypothetical protein
MPRACGGVGDDVVVVSTDDELEDDRHRRTSVELENGKWSSSHFCCW